MKYQAIITGDSWARRISYKSLARAKAERFWWEQAAKDRGFELVSFKVLDKETKEIVFEKIYKEG